MNQLHTALTFSLSALEFMVLPPLGLMLVVATTIVVQGAWKLRGRLESLFGESRHWAVLTHLLFFPAVIAAGVLLPASTLNGQPRSPNRFGNATLYLLLCASLVSCVFWIWKLKRFRWLAVGLMGLMELPVLGALIVAGMSVTGDWL
jgi:hypothetical protein